MTTGKILRPMPPRVGWMPPMLPMITPPRAAAMAPRDQATVNMLRTLMPMEKAAI